MFDSTGLAIQDLAIALAALDGADQAEPAAARALAHRHHHPEQPVRLHDDAGQLELRQRCRDDARRKSRCRTISSTAAGASATAARTASSRGSSAAGDRWHGSTPTTAQHVLDARDRDGAEAEQRVRPFESRDVISPGTASTSRPSSSARSAVINAPLRSRASTTTVASHSPATIRFRAGNRHGAGSTPGGYSETISPRSTIDAASTRCARG